MEYKKELPPCIKCFQSNWHWEGQHLAGDSVVESWRCTTLAPGMPELDELRCGNMMSYGHERKK